VTVTVSGLVVNTPGNPLSDPFYAVDPNDTSMVTAPAPDWLRYDRLSEGSCLCSYECAATSHRVTDLLVGGYPPYSASHQYTVTLDLGSAPAERLNFGIADCGCGDNSGTHAVKIAPACAP
jgi:hypothetical protein